MTISNTSLNATEPVPPPLPGHLGWQLVHGLIAHSLSFVSSTTTPRVHALDLPGDLILPAGSDDSARALMACELAPVAEPRTRADWHAQLMRASREQRRRAADLAALRTGPAADRVRHLLLMLAAPDAPPQRLPSLRVMSSLVDMAPETVSRVVSALRQLRLLNGGPPEAARRACQSARQLAVRPLPGGLSSSRTLRRPAHAHMPLPSN